MSIKSFRQAFDQLKRFLKLIYGTIVYTCKRHIYHNYFLVIITPRIFSSKTTVMTTWKPGFTSENYPMLHISLKGVGYDSNPHNRNINYFMLSFHRGELGTVRVLSPILSSTRNLLKNTHKVLRFIYFTILQRS